MGQVGHWRRHGIRRMLAELVRDRMGLWIVEERAIARGSIYCALLGVDFADRLRLTIPFTFADDVCQQFPVFLFVLHVKRQCLQLLEFIAVESKLLALTEYGTYDSLDLLEVHGR